VYKPAIPNVKITTHPDRQGIALIVVMVTIFVLATLAGGFAYSMKVETKLARNASYDSELELLGRSGVEYCRWILGQQLSCGGEPYDALNQTWSLGRPAGNCSTNGPLAGVLENVHQGNGSFTWKITDLDRKFNLNIIALNRPDFLEQAFALMGVDSGESPAIVSAIQDWLDPDNDTHINGAENDYYQGLNPPYFAKNGPVDDLSELLLVRGVTPEIFWGSSSTNARPAAFQQQVDRFGRPIATPTYPFGLVDVFTPISSGRININTASSTILQMLLGGDEAAAACVIQQRAGLDGADGTDDDVPFHNVGELANCLNYQNTGQIQSVCTVRSSTFEVQIDAQIAGYKRRFTAILGRTSQQDIQVLAFYWK
jgi:type II secretory pathway component PulK